MVAGALKALYFFSGIMIFSVILTWMERKQSALMQDRIGANRASIFGIRAMGLPHMIADAVKMMMKEEYVPPQSSYWLHALAPWFSIVSAFLPMAVIPFGSYLVVGGRKIELVLIHMDVGLLYAPATASLAIYGVVIAGWVTRNKWAILGSLRGGGQFIAFGAVLGLALVGCVMVYETLDLKEIVEWQNTTFAGGWLPRWGLFYQPLAFLLFLIIGIGETKRIPFDIPEGESEIIGYFVEFSGMRFGAYFLADFIETIMVAMLIVTLFLGGWSIPYIQNIPGHPNLTGILHMLIFWVKVWVTGWFLLLVRWTLPRFRIDQTFRLAWENLLPLALLNAFLTAFFILLW